MSNFLGYSGILFNSFHLLDLNQVEVVVVSGDGPNICGHMLLHAKPFYFHVAALRDYPYFFKAAEYERYISENGKMELFRLTRKLPHPKAAQAKLANQLKRKWVWGVIPHNCADFVEDIVGAGEGDMNLISNCPTQLESAITREIKSRELRSKLERDRMRWFKSRGATQ